ncbi:SORL protein, partial [Acromyrmex heyeri]
MSDAAGTDNPAFANEDECVSGSKLENGSQQQAALNQDHKSSADSAPVENGHQRSFISQHYVEPIKPSSEPCYKTETRIEVPADNTEKTVPESKLNGVHGNGNNNDASFLNNSATSVQINDSGKKEQIEAVNLELVSMRPYTGNNIQTKGQEACEVPADPYEEYFVPVNEHRKYISRGPEAEVETTVAGVRFDLGPGVGREGLSLRDPAAGLVDYSHWLTALRGEKLYVTKDKRSRNSYWRRMAWGCALLVIVIAVIIAILAATGVFPIPATEPLENVEENNTRQFNEVQTAGSREFVKDPPLSPPPLTSTFSPWPTTDETLFDIVPDALDGTLRLDDFNWNDDFSDIKSRVYRQVSSEIEEHLGNILRQAGSMSIIKVYDINKEGEIRFRISHPPRNAPEESQEYIEDVLRKNGNMIGEYHLNRLHVGKLIDQCEYGNLECTGNCKYDYSSGIFVCTCKLGEILHHDGKTCVDDSDLSNVEMDDVIPQSTTEPIDDFQGRSRDPGAINFEPRHPNTWKNTDFKTGSAETDTSTVKSKTKDVNPEQSDISIEQQTEFTPTTKHSVFENDSHWNHEYPEPSAEPEPKIIVPPELTVKPEPEPTPILSTAVPNPASEPEPTAKPEIAPEVESTIKAESITERESTAKLVPVTESATTINETDTEVKSKTESQHLTTEPYLKSKTEISDRPEFSVKPMSHDDTSESSTQTSSSDDAGTTNVFKSLIELTDKSDNSNNNETPITTVKPNENPTDNDTPLQIIPLTSKDINDNVDTKTTTIQSYSKNDEITESTIIEADLTTLNYRDLKQNGDVNVTSAKPENHAESVTEQFTENPNLREDKENVSTTKTNFDTNLNNIQNGNSATSEHDLITKQKSDIDLNVFEQVSLTTATTTMPVTSVEEKTESTTKFIINDRHSSTGHIHTIEINGINNRNPETNNYTKVYETTTIPETTPIDIFTQPILGYREELVPEPALQPNTPDSNEKNVIEHMPTTIFPKVPENFAHNVEPLREPIVKSADDEHIMLIPKSEQPVEIHAIIPELIPEQVTNKSLKAENSITKENKSVEDTTSIDSSTIHTNENIVPANNNKHAVRPDEIQEHLTSHPLHPAVFPENSVDHFTGKSDDRPAEDMSPFLPDVHKEKESLKKPRLDKDEQDGPNPFETHIDDVITHRPLTRNNADRVNETETKDLLIDVISKNNEKKVDIMKEITQNHEINTTNNVDNSTNTNNTESKILNVLHQNNTAKSIDNDGTKGITDQENGGFSEDKELKVIPLAVEDKSVDSISQTTLQPIDKKTEPEVVTSAGKKVQEVEGITIESVTSSEKPEENAVEDHYNDITDETLSKGYQHDNTGIPIKVIESSKKAVLKDIDPIKVSYNGPYSSLNTFDVIKKKNGTNEKISSDMTQSPMVTKTDGVVNNQMEDGRLTTQEPVLPIEIQQEMSTTTDKVEITTVIGNGKHEENNTEPPNVGQSDEKEAVTAQVTTTQATLETKTTAQIPILPEELQTTESDILSTTLSEEISSVDKKMETTDKTVSTDDANNATKKNEAEKESAVTPSNVMDTSERSMAATTVYESNISLGTGRKIEYDKNGQIIESATESMKIETTPIVFTIGKDIAGGVEGTSPMPNDVTTTEDVRPVTEMLDDTEPMIDYRILFTTIPPRPILLDPELSEETLRVIPLEKSQESKKKPIDKKGFDKHKYKKEKDLSLEDQNEDNVLTEKFDQTILSQTEPSTITTTDHEELHDSVVSSDIYPNIPRFTVADKEGNIVPISKWKDTAARTENKDVIAETKPKNYPSFIPVSEEIIESVPVTEPYVIMRNYTRPMIITNEAEKTAANETVEGPTNIRANETTGQNATFFSDQVFSDHEEAKVDHVTEESTTQTSTLKVEIENTTASNPSEFPFPGSLLKCSTGQFQCVNGTSRNGAYCVPQSAKCDSENDCSDGSDEWNCTAEGCSSNFRCANGHCLKRHLVCNKIVDCDDGSDEHNCENWQCQSDEFRCPSGKCIPGLWRCDGRPDCEEHQDEYNCAETCGNNEYLCPTEKWCIPQAWHCNGVADCVNGEDEKLCDCTLDQFKCQSGGCIPRNQVCDGIENCPDYSDEWSCLIANITADRNLTNAETDSNAASEANRVPFLKIRQYNGDYQLVCSDGWSEEFSDSYCQALGFAGSDETLESFAWDRSQKILRLKTNPNYRLPLVTNLEEVGFCVSDKVMQVSCQEFICGLHYTEESTTRLTDPPERWSSTALLKKSEEGTVCTASIIGPMHALTSYSCIYR